jgi:SOS response regulatory protein OraA/RecX
MIDFRVALPESCVEALRAEALSRGLTANELARRLLRHIIDDKLIDAVLDGDGKKS